MARQVNIKMMNQGIHFQDKNKYSLGQTFDQGNNQFQFAGVDTDKQNAAMYFYVTKNTIAGTFNDCRRDQKDT